MGRWWCEAKKKEKKRTPAAGGALFWNVLSARSPHVIEGGLNLRAAVYITVRPLITEKELLEQGNKALSFSHN